MSIRPAFAELTSPRSKLPMQSVTERWRRSLLLLRRTARGYRCCSPQFAEAATDRLRLSQWMRQRRLRSAIRSWKHSISRRVLSTAPFPRHRRYHHTLRELPASGPCSDARLGCRRDHPACFNSKAKTRGAGRVARRHRGAGHDKSSALPIHSGTEAYLTGNLTSFSDQLQNALYWIGIAASAAVSLGALSAAAYRRVRPRQPPSRVMRLLEIWLAVRTANRGDLDGLEAETDEILDASVRADARGQAAESEVRLVSLLISHVREAIQRGRAGNGERSSGRSHTDPEIPSLTAEDVTR